MDNIQIPYIKTFIKIAQNLRQIFIHFEQKIIEYFDLINWLKSKVENRTMEDIMSNKVITKEKITRGVM